MHIYWVLPYSVDFKARAEFWNQLSKAVPVKFQGSGGHNEVNCLQDRANFRKSRAWQIVSIFNTVCVSIYFCVWGPP